MITCFSSSIAGLRQLAVMAGSVETTASQPDTHSSRNTTTHTLPATAVLAESAIKRGISKQKERLVTLAIVSDGNGFAK